jgi:hypothetical protein
MRIERFNIAKQSRLERQSLQPTVSRTKMSPGDRFASENRQSKILKHDKTHFPNMSLATSTRIPVNV